MAEEPREDIAVIAVKSVFWVSMEKWGSRIISLSVFVVLGRLLEPRDFGLVALCSIFITILGLFVDSGFPAVLVQRAVVTQRQIATAFWTSLAIGTTLYVALVFAAPYIADAYDQPKLTALLRVLGISLPMTAFASTPAALLERTFNFRALFTRQISGVIAGSVFGVGAALLGFGVWALAIQTLSSSLISAIVLWIKGDWHPSFQYSFEDLKDLWGLGIAILGTDGINLINSQADKLIVGSVLGPSALGYYYVGSRIVSLMSDSFTAVIAQVSLTTFSRLQEDPGRLLRGYLRATATSSSIAVPAFAAVVVLAPTLIPVLFGAKWASSILIMQLLAPSAALNSVIYFDKSALIASGFAKSAFGLSLANTLLGLVLVLAASPFGAVGVALSRSVRQFLFWPVRIIVLRKRIGIVFGPYMKQFVRPIIAGLITTVPMLIAYLLLDLLGVDNKATEATVLIVIALVAYGVAIRLVAQGDLAVALAAASGRIKFLDRFGRRHGRHRNITTVGVGRRDSTSVPTGLKD